MSRLIDADALIPDYLVITTANNTPCKRYVSMEQIHNAPTFEPERKGKWIVHPEVKDVYGGTYIECSQCGEKYIFQHMEDKKYCLNCGAKMEVEK